MDAPLSSGPLASAPRPGLAAPREALEAALDAVPVPAAVLGKDLAIRHVNQAWAAAGEAGALVAPDDRPGMDHGGRLRRAHGFASSTATRWAGLLGELASGARDQAALEYELRPAQGTPGLLRSFAAEARCVTADGQRWILVTHRDRTGEVRRREAESVALEQALRADALRGMEKLHRRAMLGLGQEINASVTPILLQLHLMRARRFGPVTMAQARAIDMVSRNVDRWSRVCQAILQESPEARTGEPGPVDLRAEAASAVQGALTSALQAGLRVAALAPGPPVWVRAEPHALRAALQAYLDWATHATPSGGRIEVAVHQDAGQGVVEVLDGNPGSSQDSVARLFDPSLDAVRTGQAPLALHRARSAVEALGGSVWAELAEAGTLLGLRLPAVAPA